MKFGVNYTPRVGWFHAWQDFDHREIEADLAAIATLGVDHIRIFPLWPLIQPNRGLIREAGLRDVATVVKIAAEHGLDVNVDALQGHLSSFDFVPAWISTWHRRGMFTDPEVVASTAEYVRRLTAAVAPEPNLLGVTVGNETNQFGAAPHPDPYTLDAEAGHAWLATMIDAIRAETSTLATHSMYDAGWYDPTQPFGPEHATRHGDATVVHSWVFNGSAQLAGGLDPASTMHAEYLCRLAAAWHTEEQSERPVWLQEVGAPLNVLTAEETIPFIEQTIAGAMTIPHLMGITWWCSHDVNRGLLDFPELEYTLGLFDSEGRMKPTGEAFAAAIERFRNTPPAPSEGFGEAIEVDDVDRDPRADLGPGRAVHRRWLDAHGTAVGAGNVGHGVPLRLRSHSPATLATR